MSVRTFEEGDRVIISDDPVDPSDRRYSRKVGKVEGLAHRSGDKAVYRVVLDDGPDYGILFYDQDLLHYDELVALRVQLAEAENRVVELKEAIKLKERDASDLPISTVITAKGEYGPSVITKQADDLWLNISTSQDGEPKSTILDNERVSKYLAFDLRAVVRRP